MQINHKASRDCRSLNFCNISQNHANNYDYLGCLSLPQTLQPCYGTVSNLTPPCIP